MVDTETPTVSRQQSPASLYRTVEDLLSLVAGITEMPRGIKTSGREDRRRRRRQRRRKKSNCFNIGRWFYHETISHIRFISGEIVPAFSMNYKLGKPGKSNKGQSGAVVAIADTGAAVSVMPQRIANKLGVKIDTSELPKLRAAN